MVSKKKNKHTLYRLFINFFIKNGNKKAAKKIVDGALIAVSMRTGKSINIILSSLFIQLSAFIEIRRIKVKRRLYTIPFPLRFNRRLYVILKWLNTALKEDTRKVSFTDKLIKELLNIVLDMNNSKSIKLKLNNNLSSVSHRSNIHFRW